MRARLLDERLRLELIGELVQPAQIETGPEFAVMRLDEEALLAAVAGQKLRQAASKHRVEGSLEREPPFARECPDAGGDLGVQGDGGPHSAIIPLRNRAVTRRNPATPRLPRPRPTIPAMTEPALAAPLRALLAEEADGLVAAWLFGSRARGEEKPGSDVDVGVLFDRPLEPRLGNQAHRLEAKLEAALGLPVQLVAVNTAPPDLVHRVLRDGILLLDRSPRHRVAFEVKARNEFFDLQPVLTRYREARP